MIKVSPEEFQQILEEAFDSIPANFKKKLDNIAFIIEDYPSENDLKRLGMSSRNSLLGLYSGIPYTSRNTWYAGATPDRIILFQRNIEDVCMTREDLKEKIKEVLIHEIAHYFGMNEKEIRDAGY